MNFYKRFGYFNHFIRRWRMKIALEWIEGYSVLDVGCGFGLLSTMLPDETKYLGIDNDASVLKIALEFQTNHRQFIHMCVGEDSLNLGKFDNIVLCAVIEHMENAKGILRNVKNNLNPSGRMIITTPTKKSEKILLYGSKIGLFHKESIAEHCHYFDKKPLLNLMEEIGLQLIHYDTFEFALNQVVVGQMPE